MGLVNSMRAHKRNLTSRRLLQAAMAIGLVVGVTSAGAPAQAAPERVLQNVAVTMGADSSITGIESTAVRAGEGDDLTSDTQELAPSDVADQLPVRILTSYRMGDKTGTDLSEIEGESGRVVIDVTVQNTTAKPEQLTFDFNGAKERQYALVATPMTVVGSATLGKGQFGTIVTRDDVNPEQVTNGVVGKSDDTAVTDTEGADVQWAALLAPPRLDASATFTLVLDTDDFQAPAFDFSIQPGMVTDASVQRLLQAAFADDPSSTLALETKTIDLVGSVNTTLTGASAVLAQIQRELGSTAGTLGAKTIADLEAGSEHVASSLSGLSQDLEDLDQTMAGEMRDANAETVQQFSDTVEEMKALLGDPSGFNRSAQTRAYGCEESLPKMDAAGSITEQMMAVTKHLKAIRSATGDCQARIIDGLRRSIGTKNDAGTQCDSVMCGLNHTRNELRTQATALVEKGEEAAEDLEGTLLEGLADVGTSVEDVRVKFGEVRVAARSVRRINSPEFVEDLEEIRADLVAINDELVPVLSTSLSDAGAEAQATLDELRRTEPQLPPEDERSPERYTTDQQIDQVARMVCEDYALSDDALKREKDETSVLLRGETCAPGPLSEIDPDLYPLSLAEKIERAETGLQAVVDFTTNPANNEAIAEIQARTDEQIREINTLIGQLRDPNDDDGRYYIPALLERIDDLEQDWPDDWTCEDLPGTPGQIPDEVQEPVEMLEYRYTDLACNNDDLKEQIVAAFEEAGESIEDSADEMNGHKETIDQARVRAEGDVDTLVGNLQSALGDADTSIRRQGKDTVTDQRRRLDQQKTALSSQLDERITEAVRRINGQVSSSVTDLRSSQRTLTGDLNQVLLDLGDRSDNGTGILGSLSKGAADTGSATTQVMDASRTAAAFGNVRSEALREVYLQQEQLSRSLELQEAFPVFGIDLPEGSDALTVFTYRLEG